MSAPVWRVTSPLDDRTVAVQLKLARDARQEQIDRANRNASRIVSILGVIASGLALYDLALLTIVG